MCGSVHAERRLRLPHRVTFEVRLMLEKPPK